ncbi:lipid-binding SYLF domain-containing protein [Zwartia vadi]|uniref:lipid-binding SYLF domain-containing protein n=1 Tax=Zwartia vadi TaxID=3058168 RepID=UPI0025B2958B|nr:lipid-binding SYLF domain-containing protein [Zwartia vadi]MDN3987239.1 lipid-binding SYLF domain-containing protein [Zwartia vadi]
MTLTFRKALFLFSLSVATLFASSAHAENRAALERSSRAALNSLIAQNAVAKELSTKAAAILVFPSVKKAGLMIGGQYGEGVLWRGDKASAFYNTGGASFGFQAGAQEYGYAMFFMTEQAVNALNVAQGFEVGVGPSVVVVDQGMGNSTTTTTMQKDIYAFVFGQKGLMAGIGIQGNKITKIEK